MVEAPTIVSLVRVFEQTVAFQLAHVVVLAMEVTKVFFQDRVQQRLPSRTLTFLLVVVFKASIQTRCSQRFFQILMETHYNGQVGRRRISIVGACSRFG